MRKYLIGVIIFFAAFDVLKAGEIVLTGAVLSDGGISPRTPEQKAATIAMSEILASTDVDPYAAIASTNLGEGSIWYRLYDDMKIFSVNVSTKQYLGSWKLDNYPDMTMMYGERDATGVEIPPDVTSDSPQGKDLARPVYNQTSYYWHRSAEDLTCGCLNEAPLRYGDLEGDGQKELILLTVKNFVVFSPVLHKVIFANNYQKSDQMLPEDQENYLDDILKSKYESLGENRPQLLAASSISHEVQEPLGAVRSFGKIYIGHFSNETANDILLWRKLYTSRATSDPVRGFAKRAELFVHYKLVNGEYKKQETEQEIIKGWLTAKNLTWQKGYPSKSECPGQEGQLIPEMHDPLLNDPDVLK